MVDEKALVVSRCGVLEKETYPTLPTPLHLLLTQGSKIAASIPEGVAPLYTAANGHHWFEFFGR